MVGSRVAELFVLAVKLGLLEEFDFVPDVLALAVCLVG